ncbi:DUF2786 domain-containing protein [Streptomyces sp. NPDC055897]
MSTAKKNPKLDTIRALLAKAEDSGATEAEAELARGRAMEMMAKYGIEQALLADGKPSSDAPASRYFSVENPWAMQRARLLSQVADAVGCMAIHVGKSGSARRVHVFGYESDIQRAEVLYTSLQLQMHSALAAQRIPYGVTKPKAWRHSWQLGFIVRVSERLKEIENAAREAASGETSATGRNGALVLADRAAVVAANFRTEYPQTVTRGARSTGSGYGHGTAAGDRADIGGTRRIGAATAGALAA